MTIQELSEKYDLVKDDYWFHKPSGQWIIKHDAVEKIANKEGIKLVNIETLNSETDLVRFIITMGMPNGGQIKSVGEADKSNCFSQYLGCMAEKRGIDRCVLKGINAYQYGISSEVEAEDFKKPDSPNVKHSIEDEAESTGITQAHVESVSQNTSETPKNDLICPLCSKEVVDKRVWKDGIKSCPISPKGKNLPAFRCIDNDDYQNPTCKFASWKLDELEAGVAKIEEAPHRRQEDQEIPQQAAEDLPF